MSLKNSVKKCISLIAAAVMLCTLLASCAPKPQDVFKQEADSWFEGFSDAQTAAKPTVSYQYSKNGSIAVSKPSISVVEADRSISDYYEKLKNEFINKAVSDEDKLLISYKSFKASEDITGIEVSSKQTLSGTQSQYIKTFNYDSQGLVELDDTLRRITMIHARDLVLEDQRYGSSVDKVKLKDSTDYQLLYTDSGIDVIYSSNALTSQTDEHITVHVPYSKIRFALPESIKAGVVSDDSVRTVDITKKLVALTFDDGPSSIYTDQILDVLETYDSVATFFDLGCIMENAPQAMQRASQLGCEMGSHSYSHKNLKKASVEKIKEEISSTDAVFEKILGYKPTLLRPPYGDVGSDLKENCDKYLIGWSVDTLDWKYRDKDKVIESVKSEGNLDGDVILMHSIYKSTAQAVEELVPWLIENGYQLVTVSELMKYRYETEMEPGKYYASQFFESHK